MGRKENTLLKSINPSIFVIGGLASVPLGFVFFTIGVLRANLFFHTIIWAKVFTCCM